ncbi:BrnA antitoxin family protein [Asticcacaulis sp. EMRT-3]|nr:BrnA antitoxin family protein [Asticcacaulis sp. EMRT-3]MDI7774106.1 BrnA antitoxin family protein [Asticcacaulis sp. EMRT-3]
MKTRSGETLSPELLDHLKILEAMPDDAIDTNDIPEVSDWSRAERGKFYRPVKKPYSLRLDADVVAWFKASGDGYQTRINAALREYVLTHSKKSA